MNDILPAVSNRAQFVRDRIGQINKTVTESVYENALLLNELKENAYYREFGFASFDECVTSMQDRGEIDYGPRQARNFLAIAKTALELGMTDADVADLGMSKMRAIAGVPGDKSLKQEMVEQARTMTVADVEKAARGVRSKVLGHDKDPLDPVTLMMTETQKTFYRECIAKARIIAGLSDDAGEAGVLVDCILAEWHSGLQEEVPE